MKRKDFNRLLLLSAAGGLASCVTPKGKAGSHGNFSSKIIKPPKLKKGDTVGLIAPGSHFSADAYKRTLENLEKLGLKFKNATNLFKKYGYVAGSDKERLDDIHQMFADPEVKAIWCVRGGYGTTRLLYDLDYELIRHNPKIIAGYSDITALLNAIFKKTGLVTFHAPVGSSKMNEYTFDNFKKILMEGDKPGIKIHNYTFDNDAPEYRKYVITEGDMTGRLAGGNLTLLAAIAGTPYQLDAKDKIVFIEDIEEKPYRIDRMLTQLIQTSKLETAAGILLGIFKGCDAEGDNTLRLHETLKDRLAPLGIPVFYGFAFGHVEAMCTLPVGIKAHFDYRKEELTLLENAVS